MKSQKSHIFPTKVKKKKSEKLKFIIAGLLTVLLVFIACHTDSYANDTSKYYSNLSDSELEEIYGFNLYTDVIGEPWKWIMQQDNIVIIEDTESGYQYWWNAPNIQDTYMNEVYEILLNSGYGYYIGVKPIDREMFVDCSEVHTAVQKYGFKLPSPMYQGERPLIAISTTDVILPDNIMDGIVRLVKFIFTGDIVKLPTDEDFNTLVYLAPRDYNPSSNTFRNWVAEYWDKAMQNIEPGQILMSNADPETGLCAETGDVVWVKEAIIDQNGLTSTNGDPDWICSKLKYYCGTYYSDVCSNIIKTSGYNQLHNTERIMPYDYDSLTLTKDKELFNGIRDPRSEMQLDLDASNQIITRFKSWFYGSLIMNISSFLSALTIKLNQVATFDFFENTLGIKGNMFWDRPVVNFFLVFMGVAFLFYCVYIAIKTASHKIAYIKSFQKIVSMFLICIIIYAISMDLNGFYTNFKSISESIMNFGNTTLTYDYQLSALYGDGDSNQKFDCSLYLPYFDLWTQYNTGHSLMDDAQMISNTVGPENDNLIIPDINGVEQTLWSTVLADEVSRKKVMSGNVYRMVDNFMAPRISDVSVSKGDISFNTEVNPDYNGYIQSGCNFLSILFQILIFLLVLFKLIVFVELMFHIIMFIYYIALYITDLRKVKETVKELFTTIIMLFIVNTIISMVVYISLMASESIVMTLIMALVCYYAVISIFISMVKGNFPFTPKLFKSIDAGVRKVGYMFEEH